MPRGVCIVGFSEMSRDFARTLPDYYEIWGVNEGHRCSERVMAWKPSAGQNINVQCPCLGPSRNGKDPCNCRGHAHIFMHRYDRWFQIHPPDWKLAPREALAKAHGKTIHPDDRLAYGRSAKHLRWLKECGVPVYQLHVNPDIPTAVKYPLDEVTEALGIEKIPGLKWLYSTSTPAYMMALAIYEHLTGKARLDEFACAGIELAVGTEYYYQRPCMEYYIGLMQGMGIKFVMPPTGSSLLGAPRYAIDDPPVIPWDIRNEKDIKVNDLSNLGDRVASVDLEEESEVVLA